MDRAARQAREASIPRCSCGNQISLAQQERGAVKCAACTERDEAQEALDARVTVAERELSDLLFDLQRGERTDWTILTSAVGDLVDAKIRKALGDQ